MFRELGLPSDDDWATRGPIWIDSALRDWFKRLAQERVQQWDEEPSAYEKSILRLNPELRLHLAVISLMSATRLRLDRELLLLTGQAEELGATWTALAEAHATTPQNAHKVFAKRLMGVRGSVANGWDVEQAVDEFYRRKS
ncbi:hypothetical protein [Micromonospora sp. NPDC048839]|uniref:hypothetical protein n=1 Tax=Micromonospora sp. NPDC048839 TaxID=3155641 RepID=UPI003404809E